MTVCEVLTCSVSSAYFCFGTYKNSMHRIFIYVLSLISIFVVSEVKLRRIHAGQVSASELYFYVFNFTYWCVCGGVCGCVVVCVCDGMHEEVRGQLWGAGLLLYVGFRDQTQVAGHVWLVF